MFSYWYEVIMYIYWKAWPPNQNAPHACDYEMQVTYVTIESQYIDQHKVTTA